MQVPHPSPANDPRRKVGASGLATMRRSSLGWRSLAVSLGFHGSVMAAVAWLVVGGQGDNGDLGMDLADADAAPATVFTPLPKAQPQPVTVPQHPTKSFKPANMPRLLAATDHAEIVMPKWDMAPMQSIDAPPAPAAPKAAPAAKPERRSEATAKGTASRTMRKAEGRGASGGIGSARIAARVPQIVSSYAPPYPASAKRAGIQGTATIKVAVSTRGRVLGCSLYSSTGNESLDAAALRAVRGWRFTPAEEESAEVLVKVTFRLG